MAVGPATLVLGGGTVWTETGPRRTDVQVGGGVIAALGDDPPADPAAVTLDAGGMHVLPGLIDAHVHADDRIGGRTLADTWASASAVALANGITTLAGFATQEPGESLTATLARCRRRAARSRCGVVFHLTPTSWPWDWDEVGRLVTGGLRTFKLYTTYREAGLFTSYERLAEVMARLAPLGVRLLVHCEDDAALAAVPAAGLDRADPASHARLRPEAAEAEAVARVLDLAARTGCRTHVVHVSTPGAAARVAAARRDAPVSCETAPHYLLLDESRLRAPEGHRWLCTPPLRPEASRAGLESFAAAGAFDLYATDHCAFTRADKDGWGRDLRAAAFGVAGLGALVPLAFELLVVRHGLGLGEVVTRLAANPARLLGLYPRKGVIRVGAEADLVVVDAHGPERPVASTFADAWETYPGCTTTWNVRHVLRGGEVVVRDGAVIAEDTGGGRARA